MMRKLMIMRQVPCTQTSSHSPGCDGYQGEHECIFRQQDCPRPDDDKIRQEDDNANVQRDIAGQKMRQQIRPSGGAPIPKHDAYACPDAKAAKDRAGKRRPFDIVEKMEPVWT